MKKRVNKYNTADKVKDTITLTKQYLPSDMDEPTVNVLEVKRDLMRIAVSSDKATHGELIAAADKLKDKISLLKKHL